MRPEISTYKVWPLITFKVQLTPKGFFVYINLIFRINTAKKIVVVVILVNLLRIFIVILALSAAMAEQ